MPKKTNYIGAGVAIGVGVGLAIGASLDNISAGLPIGIGLGLCWAQWMNRSARSKKNNKATPVDSERQ